jgi:NADH dehydrogenase
MLSEVVGFDIETRHVILTDGRVEYDTLVVAAGMTHSYFGHDDWEAFAPGLKTVEDATEIRRRLLRAFEDAERSASGEDVRQLLTFVVIGGGPTGVEMAGAISELARHTLRKDFRRIDPAKSRIVLIEGAERVLPPFRPPLSARAQQSLERLGVEVWTQSKVIDIRADSVTVVRPTGIETLAARTVIWAAGVQASPLGKKLALAVGTETDRAGRVPVGADLTIPGHPEIFVIGDLAAVQGADGKLLPGMAPVAIQQGKYVGTVIRRRLRGESIHPFRYKDKGSMATIGRAAAVADLGWTWFSGYFAWLAWLFVHIIYLIRFENRLLVLMQWAWNYVTRNRTARLITGEEE